LVGSGSVELGLGRELIDQLEERLVELPEPTPRLRLLVSG
jgi:hypothetical protein